MGAQTCPQISQRYESYSGEIQQIPVFLDKRPIVNPNDGFLSQLITYEGILNAIKNRYSFGRDFESGGAGEQMNDSDIDLHNEIRVKKLVQFIQEREKAEIRRSKSNSRSSKRFTHYVMMTSSPHYYLEDL